ncbi:MAG TPA: 50S ribosomal protein L17 [Geminicoccaceae bacterium]
MRHRMRSRRFSRDSAHRQHMFANLAISLVEHEQITTTLPKAKELRPIVEKLITLGKKGGLHRRRLIISRTRSEDAASKILDVLAPRYATREGGYCRIMHAGFRHGDNAPVAIIELVDRDVDAKGRVDRDRLAAEAALAGPADAA